MSATASLARRYARALLDLALRGIRTPGRCARRWATPATLLADTHGVEPGPRPPRGCVGKEQRRGPERLGSPREQRAAGDACWPSWRSGDGSPSCPRSRSGFTGLWNESAGSSPRRWFPRCPSTRLSSGGALGGRSDQDRDGRRAAARASIPRFWAACSYGWGAERSTARCGHVSRPFATGSQAARDRRAIGSGTTRRDRPAPPRHHRSEASACRRPAWSF